MQTSLRVRASLKLACVSIAWAVGVGAGVFAMVRYEATPGYPASAQPRWSSANPWQIRRHADQPTLLMFVHPFCPCSRASLTELQRVMQTPAGQRADVHLLFLTVDDTALDDSPTWRRALQMGGVTLHRDVDPGSMLEFGATTSGFVALYGEDGALRFSGGITGGRGHDGDNASEAALLLSLSGGLAAGAPSPTFGCALSGVSGTIR